MIKIISKETSYYNDLIDLCDLPLSMSMEKNSDLHYFSRGREFLDNVFKISNTIILYMENDPSIYRDKFMEIKIDSKKKIKIEELLEKYLSNDRGYCLSIIFKLRNFDFLQLDNYSLVENLQKGIKKYINSDESSFEIYTTLSPRSIPLINNPNPS